MEKQKKEQNKEDKLGKAPEQEVKVWGLGITNNKLDKLIEILDKSQKWLYFMESRQKRMEEQNIEIIDLLKQISKTI